MAAEAQIVILAGGQGSRFWPISRMDRPKQFLSISASGESLIQATVRRVAGMSTQPVLVVTNIRHQSMVSEHVPSTRIICEPIGKNTAASIGLAAISIRRSDPKAIMVVLPADHFIRDEAGLVNALARGVAAARSGENLVVLGVTPATPNTAYGYIKRGSEITDGAYKVLRFFEKPSKERAVKYLESGDFFWNSGMFVWRVDAYLNALQTNMPELYQGLMAIDKAFGTKEETQVFLDIFNKIESISVDFGVLEHAKNCVVVETGDIGWTDVGSWDAWADRFNTDSNGNLLHGDATAIESSNCVVYSKNRLIAVLGCSDMVVIDSKDALLVCPRSQVQHVRKIVDDLKSKGRTDLI